MNEGLIDERIRYLSQQKTSINDAEAESQETTYSASKIEERLSEIPSGGIEEAPIDGNQYARKDAGWEEVVAGGHTQNTDTNLGALSTKNPPIDADKAIYRDSTASDALVTSTWTQIKAFLKTYFDTIYQAVGSYLTSANIDDTAYNATSWNGVTTNAPSKNAVRDKIETMDTSISGKQDALGFTPAREFTEYYWDENLLSPLQVDGNGVMLINTHGSGAPTLDADFVSSSYSAVVLVKVQDIRSGDTLTLDFGGALNGGDPNIDLTTADNGSSMIFAYSPTESYWYQIL